MTVGTRRRPLDRSAFYAELWRSTADLLGLEYRELLHGFAQLRSPQGTIHVRGTLVPVDDPVAFEMAGDKEVVTTLLAEASIPTPEQVVIRPASSQDALGLLERGPVVVKPAARTGGGEGVVTHVSSPRQLRWAVIEASAYSDRVVVERQIPGHAYRLLYLDGQLLDAVERRPATVTGDGRHDVATLVRAENARRSSLGGHATGFIPLGFDLHTTLATQGLRRRSTPRAGRGVVVSGRSNTGAAEDSRSVLAEVCADVRDVGARASATLGVRLAGVDVITTDIASPLDGRGVVSEVNTSPGLHWHYLLAGDSPRVAVAEPIIATLLAQLPR